MIERYTTEAMADFWTEEAKFNFWLQVEICALEGMEKAGLIPVGVAQRVFDKAEVDIPRIKELEAVTKHDTAAFVQSLEEQVGPKDGKYIHLGLTSSDIVDTAFSLQLSEASELLDVRLAQLALVLKDQAFAHKRTVMAGRTHGVHAEPITFGLVMANWYAEVLRHQSRLRACEQRLNVGKLSGSVGTYSNSDPQIEFEAFQSMELNPDLIGSQVISRDYHAEFFCVLAQIASSLEKFAVQIRHLQRTEVAEVSEAFSKGQKGSSSMPHKKNPILSENVTGLARVVRGYCIPALENVALWHERDISHSSVERIIAPDATIALDFALKRFTGVVKNLVVREDRMRQNLEMTLGSIYSQRVLTALILAGESREKAYRTVQKISLDASQACLDFRDVAKMSEDLTAVLTPADLRECFNLDKMLRHVTQIFDRVFGESE